VFAFVLSAGRLACFVWYEAWSRADWARVATLKGAFSAAQKSPARENQYSSTFPQPPQPESPLKNRSSPQPTEVFNPDQPLPELKDLVLWRGGNLVTAQWRGSPKFSVGVLSALNDDQAFERAAVSMSLAVKPGFKEAEMKACAKEIRRRAEVNTAARLAN